MTVTEKSLYTNYKIGFDENYPESDNGVYFVFNNNRELVLNENKELLTSIDELNVNFNFYIGKLNNTDCFVSNINNENGYDLKEVYEFNPDLYQIATRAVLINDWYISHQYCGRCGSKTVIDDKDMMMRCLKCNQVHYPRIAPAIIVAIKKENKLLMAKHSYHKSNNYSLIAGFVEAGETIEDAVHREVLEEIGIKIKNLKYLNSQSWPFPNSLMLAFEAEYESGEISVDGNEIIDAKWFNKEDVRRYDSDISISDWLIERFLKLQDSFS